MANCNLCGAEVTTHRYLRAEPMREEEQRGRRVLAPVQLKVCTFYCLTHPLEAVEEDIAQNYPPSADIPVRLLWSPAPGVKLPHAYVEPFEPPKRGETEVCVFCGLPIEAEPHTIWRVKRAGYGVRESRSRDGTHGVRTVVVRDKAGLHMALPELVPAGTRWLIPHSGHSPAEAVKVLEDLFGGDDPLSEAIRDKIAKLGKEG